MNITPSSITSSPHIDAIRHQAGQALQQNRPIDKSMPTDQASRNQAGDGYDKISLSETGRRRSIEHGSEGRQTEQRDNKGKTGKPGQELSGEDLRAVQKLQQRDREVRTHEQAHLSNAGQYARGGASFSYTSGPDGRRYATGGEVPIDISSEKTPEETIQKMQAVRRAALAPANPSGADRNIAATASKKEAQARSELQEQYRTKHDPDKNPSDPVKQRQSEPAQGSQPETTSFKADDTVPQPESVPVDTSFNPS